MNPKGRELREAIEREVEHWPGVTVEFAEGGKHPKAKLWFEGVMLSRPFAGTPGADGVHKTLSEMRRIMKQLGAKRDKPEPSKEEDEAPYRKPNGGRDARPHPVAGEKAKPKPTLADQLVEVGVAAPDVEVTTTVLAPPLEVSDEPAEKLVKQLRDRGFDIQIVGAVSRAGVVAAAADMIVDGIYFGLPMEVYLNVPRLGASDLQALNASPGDFWNGSWLDPDRKDVDDEDEDAEKRKKWKLVGEAYHTARLEPDQFEVRYCRKPCRADFAERAATHGACWTGRDIEVALADLGETKKRAGETVPEQAQRLEEAGFAGVIFPLEMKIFEERRGDRKALDGKVWDEIVRDMERLRGSKEIASKFTEDGASEVSVFWTDENNIPRKARFDRLERGHWLDFKTFDNKQGKRLEQALADAIRFNRYYVTAASYRDAAEALRTLDIVGVATEVEQDLIAHIKILPRDMRCWFIFQQKSGVPNLLAREFIFFDVPQSIESSWDTGADEEAVQRGHEATRRPTQIYSKGRAEIDYAKRLFALYAGVYRPGEPWAPLDPVASISDLDFPPYWLEGRYE